MNLPKLDVSLDTQRRIEQRTLAAFTRNARRDAWSRVMRVYDRAVMPAGVAVLAVLQLVTIARTVFTS